MGSALDLWTAFREGACNGGIQPFLGYFFMLEEVVKPQIDPLKEGNLIFKVFPEFVVALYMKRYKLFCRKLILERHYTSSSFITSASDTRVEGVYNEPANDLSFKNFATSLFSHVGVFV